VAEPTRLYDQELDGDYQADVIAGYDAVSDFYDDFYTEPSDLAEDDVIFGRLKRLAVGREVVDIGCGPGTVLAKGVTTPERYTGIDPSAGMIYWARRKHPKAKFVHGEMDDAPEAHAQLLVGTFGPLCHIPPEDVSRFAIYARAACADGARLFLMASRWPEVARITGAPMVGHEPRHLTTRFSMAGFYGVRVTGFVLNSGPKRGPRWFLRTMRRAETSYLGGRMPDRFKWLIIEGVAM
jgi:SAM-dependent methyltransferase